MQSRKIVLIVFSVVARRFYRAVDRPYPPLRDTVPRELADPDSQFVEIDDLDVH